MCLLLLCLNMQLFSQLVLTCQDSDEMRCSASPFDLWNFRKTSAPKNNNTVALNWKKQWRERREGALYVCNPFAVSEWARRHKAIGSGSVRLCLSHPKEFTPKHEVQALSGDVIIHIKECPAQRTGFRIQSPREWRDSCDSSHSQKGCKATEIRS